MVPSKRNKTRQQPAKAPPKRAQATARPKADPTGPLAVYRAALSNPFDELALGARVPDMFTVPTRAAHITRRYTVTTDGTGNADLIFLPSIYHHVVSPRGNLAGAAAWNTFDGASKSDAVLNTPVTSIGQQFLNWRIVGYGIRLMGTAAMTDSSGAMFCAKVPISSWINTTDNWTGATTLATNAAMTKANTLTAWGIPNNSSVVDQSQLIGLPDAFETSMINLSESPLQLCPKISSPEAFEFKEAQPNAIGYNVEPQNPGTALSTGDASYLRLAGHEAVVVALTGCALSTPVMDFEVIYHVEGIPSTTQTQYILADTTQSVVDPIGWMTVVKEVATQPFVKQFIEGAGNSFFPGLGSLATRLW